MDTQKLRDLLDKRDALDAEIAAVVAEVKPKRSWTRRKPAEEQAQQ
jgi:hypothetical protein